MNASEGPAIAFANVRLSRGNGPLFDQLDLTLDERRIGLIGNNGSGKSSLLRLINGLLLPEAGHVKVLGHDTQEARNVLPDITGFLFQNPDHQIVFPVVAEEIAFGLRERGRTSQQARAEAIALLSAHGHADWADRPVHELSDGQKQLVCILAVTITAPDILLLDEPFSSLDLPTRHDLMQRLHAMPQRLVMASHDLDLLADFDRVIWLETGKIKGDGKPADVIGAYRNACSGRTANLLAAQ